MSFFLFGRPVRYKGHRFPSRIIAHPVWLFSGALTGVPRSDRTTMIRFSSADWLLLFPFSSWSFFSLRTGVSRELAPLLPSRASAFPFRWT